ncbi:hypothetical protein I6A93_17250 [Clostridioides difficile]|nr:hypothetical protein [Clostridioides difficile]
MISKIFTVWFLMLLVTCKYVSIVVEVLACPSICWISFILVPFSNNIVLGFLK